MANLIESMGYNSGKVHVGLIAYMCDLYRNNPAPLKSFLDTLGVPVPGEPKPIREWAPAPRIGKVDLAIFDGDKKKPCVIIEMKVDDHEKVGNHEEKGQLEKYRDATEYLTVSKRLLITLGNGEYFQCRGNQNGFTWIRLQKFAKAVNNACSSDISVINDWSIALNNELGRRENVRDNDRGNISNYRSGSWNITLLGQLREELTQELCEEIGISPTCCTYGQAPDTILHFGAGPGNLYAEINKNGKLNVKIRFNNPTDHNECRELYENNQRQQLLGLNDAEPPNRGYRRGSRSATLVSIPIGLAECIDGELGYAPGLEQQDTVGMLTAGLEQLYQAL